MIHFTHRSNNIPPVSTKDAEKLFHRISEKLDLSIPTRHPHHKAFNLLITKYYLSRFLLFLFLITMFIFSIYILTAPASVQDLNIIPISYDTQKVSFQIPNSFWIKSMTAYQNNIPLPISEDGDSYSIDVNENGVLLLEIETISHVRVQQEIIIQNIDKEAPHIESHYQNGNEIIIYLSDGNGSGIDWTQITAHTQDSNTPIFPIYYDASDGLVAFAYPKEPIQITIPDMAGNDCTALLKPVRSKS